MNLAVCIFAGGPNSTENNVVELLYNFGKTLTSKFSHVIYSDSAASFSRQFDYFFDSVKDDFDYILYCHDDIIIKTEDVIPRTMEVIKDRKDIGWITYSNSGYTSHGKLVSSSVRVSLHKDRGKYPAVFECHTGDLGSLDYPDVPVKVYGPLTHLNMISVESLKKIMPCGHFIETPTLIDEDWNLRSNIAGLTNVWIPDIFYEHPIQETEHLRKQDSLRNADTAHEVFRQKWNCRLPFTDAEILKLAHKHPELTVFADRNSYDWIEL